MSSVKSKRTQPQENGFSLADQLDRMLTFKLVRIGRIVDRITARLARLENMPVNDFKLLILIARLRSTNIKEAIRQTTIDPGNTSKSVKALVKQGLVRSVSDPRDGRKRHLEITQAGLDIIERAFPVRVGFDREICALFDRSDLARLDADLQRILDQIDRPTLLDDVEVSYENRSRS